MGLRLKRCHPVARAVELAPCRLALAIRLPQLRRQRAQLLIQRLLTSATRRALRLSGGGTPFGGAPLEALFIEGRARPARSALRVGERVHQRRP